MLRHHAQVVCAFLVLQPEIVFCDVIGGCKILSRNQPTLMKPEGLVKYHQTPLLSGGGSGHKTDGIPPHDTSSSSFPTHTPPSTHTHLQRFFLFSHTHFSLHTHTQRFLLFSHTLSSLHTHTQRFLLFSHTHSSLHTHHLQRFLLNVPRTSS